MVRKYIKIQPVIVVENSNKKLEYKNKAPNEQHRATSP
jgi:hypothetical protein